MPELPEVETIKRALSLALMGNKIKDVVINRNKIRIDIPNDFKEKVTNQKVVSVLRVAKYILINLTNDETIVMHLGMSGKVTISNEYIFKKHDHVLFSFDDGTFVSYNDARRFGFISLKSDKNVKLDKIGIDALSDDFNLNYFKSKVKSTVIKQFLLNQEFVAGLGNIYVIESLFKSKISPLKKASELTDDEISLLIKNIKEVLLNSIENGGTTLKDYRKADGSLGYFQNNLLVYGKENLPCPCCGENIKRIVQNGRSTFFCPKCQK